MSSNKFTYPFRYTPAPEVEVAANALIRRIDASAELREAFAEGKMMGTLIVSDDSGTVFPLYAFSGIAAGRATIDGFVPPVFDLTPNDGYFKRRESEIVDMRRCGKDTSDASKELQEWIFRNYVVMNGFGEEKSILEIFAERGITPPGGTGDCAAPKLLNYAFRHGLRPLSMGEFWYGRSPAAEVREQGRFYPSCTGKCGPLLSWMLRGVDVEPDPMEAGYLNTVAPVVLFSDDDIIVAKKPAGMLSVPGRTRDGSLLTWLRERYGSSVESCHRLDMDTSGVMVFARNPRAKSNIERQFAGREVRKTYRARLVAGNGPFRHKTKGTIALPLILDYYDRPRQMVDRENGKPAITGYEVLQTLPNGELEVRFTPLTGRTHQLRVHAAHNSGLGRPIKGDKLYGAPSAPRLYLHAESITFRHPFSNEELHFESDSPSFEEKQA